MMDAERVAHRVHTLCSTIEALGQELQEAHATIDLMAQTALDREQEIARLREALKSVFTIANVNHGYPYAQIEMIARDGLKGEDNATE